MYAKKAQASLKGKLRRMRDVCLSQSHLMKHAAIVIFSSSVFFNSRLPSRACSCRDSFWRGKIRLLAALAAAAVELAPTATGPVEERSSGEVSKQICLIGHCFSQ